MYFISGNGDDDFTVIYYFIDVANVYDLIYQ